MIEAELETARPGSGETFSDGLFYAWGDPVGFSFGMVRLGAAPGSGHVSALALVMDASGVQAAVAGSVPAGGPVAWEDHTFSAEGARIATVTAEPLAAWKLALSAAGVKVELRFAAVDRAAARFGGESAVARSGGLEGYEQLCVVEGLVKSSAGEVEVHGRGQRGHWWGEPDIERMALTRTLGAWLEDGRGLMLAASRRSGAKGHADEATSAFFVDPETETVAIDEPRLSTTYDAEGRQRSAGVELWEDAETEIPRRGAGQMVAGTSFDLGDMRVDAAFLDWRLSGVDGVGYYEILRKVA